MNMKKIFFPIVAILLLITSSCSNDSKIRDLMDEGKYEKPKPMQRKITARIYFKMFSMTIWLKCSVKIIMIMFFLY
jgi:hypothetical protein